MITQYNLRLVKLVSSIEYIVYSKENTKRKIR